MHLNEEQIQRLLHGELDASLRENALRHATECASCARRLEETERDEKEIFALLGAVDHPAPRVTAAALVPHTRRASAVRARRAAGFIIAAALAGAAYAVPGSPLPALLHQVAGWITGQTEPPLPPVPSASGDSTTAAQPVTSGIAVPVSGRYAIHFTTEQGLGDISLLFIDGTHVAVRALGGNATFTTDVDSLTIANQGSAVDYEIDVPRSAGSVEITVGARRLFSTDGDRDHDLALDARGRVILRQKPSTTPQDLR